jgi:hypothetical protein
MFDFKSMLASRTVWANVIGFAATLPAIGDWFGAVDVAEASLHITNAVSAVSFIASTIFRVRATKQLTTSGKPTV